MFYFLQPLQMCIIRRKVNTHYRSKVNTQKGDKKVLFPGQSGHFILQVPGISIPAQSEHLVEDVRA